MHCSTQGGASAWRPAHRWFCIWCFSLRPIPMHGSGGSLAVLGRRGLVWGRRVAGGALALFGAAVAVAWLDPV